MKEILVLVFAAASLLARQIREGAPADVFLSADEVVLLESGRIRARGAPGDVLRDRP
jgi:ABC-type molybdate transport system substrate-binding protein